MESLPLLPGYVFGDTEPVFTKDYKLKQKLKFSNGVRAIRDTPGPEDLSDAKFVDFEPTLTYGRAKKPNRHENKRFLPRYALYDKKCLNFEAYFKQAVFGSPSEHYRVRRVIIRYHLDDDTMTVMEPRVENAGFKQGKLLRKGRVPKSADGALYHWKDLNVAMSIEIYGTVYRIVNCDKYTREYLTSQGIDVSEAEQLPIDPYTQTREMMERQAVVPCKTIGGGGGSNSYQSKLEEDKLYRFLEYDGMILSFDALWDRDEYKVRYFLADNTIAICEVRKPNDGKDARSCLLLKRTKVPKNWKDVPAGYPAVCLEKTDDEVSEFYAPRDLKVGETIFIFGRRFLLRDCDSFTRSYYANMLRIDQPQAMRIPEDCSEPAATCKKRQPKSSNDLIRQLFNFPKKLRYSLVIDVVHPEDEGREFVLEYGLSDGAIRINELAQRNSGRSGGCFLGWIRVPRPDGSGEYYSPEDFYIGGKINVFGHWFVVTGTEPFVHKYMTANPQKFGEKLRENVADYLRQRGLIDGTECEEPANEGGRDEMEHVCGGGADRKELTWAGADS